MVKKWLLFWTILLIPVYAQAAALVATVNHNTIGKDGTVLLSVRITGSDEDFKLDVSPLNKSFYVIPMGSGRKTGQWLEKRYQLGPKHAGVLTIPALRASSGGNTLVSKPFTVTVRNKSGAVDDTQLWIETHIDKGSVWEKQQVIYRFTVFSTNNMVSPRLVSPDFHGFRVQPVKKNVSGERIISGRRVHTEQYVYLLFPEQPGKLRIGAPMINATLVQTVKSLRFAAGQASIGDEKQLFRTKFAKGSPESLNVRPLPPGAKNLPVGMIKIHSGITEARAVAGEPLTWTVKILGNGIPGEDLPDIKAQLRLEGSFKTYAETPDISSKKSKTGIVSNAIWREVMLPQKQGKLSLPPIEISYFNPNNGQIEKADSPAINLNVAPATYSDAHVVFQANPSKAGFGERIIPNTSSWWKWIAVFSSLMWVLTLLLWLAPVRRIHTWFKRRKQRSTTLRAVLSARNANDQFAKLKVMLGLPDRLAPLGLLEMFPQLQDDEIGKWLKILERAIYSSGEYPLPLDDRDVRRIRMMFKGKKATAPIYYAKEFGRIGLNS